MGEVTTYLSPSHYLTSQIQTAFAIPYGRKRRPGKVFPILGRFIAEYLL
jgi:hypothetical protein